MNQDTSVPTVLVQLDILSSLAGHEKGKITVDDDPSKRKQLAEKVTGMIKDGFAVFLSSGERVRGYDPESNDWLVASSTRAVAKTGILDRIAAVGRPATAVAPIAGG
jgi:hypothetical protein